MAKRSSIKIRSKWLDGKLQLRTLIAHPMDNGRHKDADGEIIPAHFIKNITIQHNESLIFTGLLSGSISKDPFFTIMLKQANSGDKIIISWEDNQQLSDSKEYILP